ncbi:hypothetical protein A3718_12115 [Erythrobacter sp. HI0019]|nr:phage protease [Erythrobacter sp. HI0019]KZX92308.1 hypothetical protein A3718_12115 [Erythrobacter sp. HI0019]
MTTRAALALCSALPLRDVAADAADSEWLHLLPGGGTVRTGDGRGPYTVDDYEALAAVSLGDGDRLVLDECHSTDLAAPKGQSAPARGWIVALEARADGIWGQVEWTGTGRQLRADKAYRGISPVIAHTKDNRIVAIKRASLVNDPNLQGLTALHQKESEMDFRAMLIELLKLDTDADDAAIEAALRKAMEGPAEEADVETAVQSALAPIRKQLQLEDGADIAATITALQAAGNDDRQTEIITSLQGQLTAVSTQLAEMQTDQALQAATRFVDNAIAEGRVGVKPQRDLYIAMHQENPQRTETLIGAMAKVGGISLHAQRDVPGRTAELDDADTSVIALMGIDPEEFKKTRAAELGVEQEAI